MVQKSKVEIINETVEYYSTHSRGLGSKGACVYLSPEGYMCAVGRCLDLSNKEFNDTLIECGDSSTAIKDLSKELDSKEIDLNNIFKEEYRNHKVAFWQSLQNFHDLEIFWIKNKEGEGSTLTVEGELRLKELLETYAD